HARAALRLAACRRTAVEAGAAALAGLAGVIGGARLDEELLSRTGSSGTATAPPLDQWSETTPEFVAAITLLWVGELERARPVIEGALRTAVDRDETALAMHARAYLSSIATGLGELELGFAHAQEYLKLAREAGQEAQRGAALWPIAVAAAWLGDEDGARAAAQDGLAIARDSGYRLYEIGILGALGLLELSLERPAAAVAALARGRELAGAFGVRALGRISLLPESVEALTLTGQVEEAAELARELDRRARRLGSPWALALSHRCAGLLAETAGDPDRAIAAFRAALAEHDRQDRAPERARTQLLLGSVLRRQRQKRDAREVLESAAAGFEQIGAGLWALRARRELNRIGGRTGSPAGRLSGTERSIADLVAAGRTNHEVGAALHLSARTVEWNLSKIYRKLGVRGRTELAAILPPRRPDA
ncbi:MAG TPA: LuxR C-terminal-related transcriptional regulator, partial [Solirubrobacteraceae bacterium]